MNFFHIRRARVRPEYAQHYPEVVPGVWMSARKATRLVRKQGPRTTCVEQQCAQERVLCERHFEFRGGAHRRQYVAGTWTERVTPLLRRPVPVALKLDHQT